MTTTHERRKDDMQRPTGRPDRRLLIGVTAVVLLLSGACDGGEDAPTTDQQPVATGASVNPADAAAVKVATGFLEEFGAFDVEQAMTYLAEDADITGLTGGSNGVEDLSLMTSFLEAQGYQQTITSCEANTLASDTSVVCAYDFHGIRSDEIGRGPFSGGTFTITVRDGEIVRATRDWEIEEFSPQMWEPFAEWVSTTYPKDAAVMYNEDLTNFRLTEESIRLWDRRTREYVKEVQGSEGQ